MSSVADSALGAEENADIHALLALGVPLSKLESLYGADAARKAAQSFMLDDKSNQDSKLSVGTQILRRSKSSKEEALANAEFVQSLIASLAEEPQEMLMDPLMMTPLKNPVVLSSGFVVDRTSALDENGQLRFRRCPFSRAALKRDVYPLVPLRKMAVEWRLKQLERCLQLAEIFADSEQWASAEQIFRSAEAFLDDLGDGTYLHIAERLANLERRAPGMSVARAVQNWRRLCAVAPAGERERLLREAAAEGLRELSALLATASEEEESTRRSEAVQAVEQCQGAAVWFQMYAWLCEPSNTAAWAELQIDWAELHLSAAKVTGRVMEVDRWIRRIWRLQPTAEARVAFLARHGHRDPASFSLVGPPFDPTGWHLIPPDGGGVGVPSSEHGLIRVGRGANQPIPTCRLDLNPREGSHWMLEVAFKVDAELSPHSHRNSIFSCHGNGNGWEVRANHTMVEVVFTMTTGGHNEFKFFPPTGVHRHEWTHALLLFERATPPADGGQLHLFIDGMGPVTQTVVGSFIACPLEAQLGRNPDWNDRSMVSVLSTPSTQRAATSTRCRHQQAARLQPTPHCRGCSQDGEVAFARVEHALPVDPADFQSYAAELARQRFAALDVNLDDLEILQSPGFEGWPHWQIRWLSGETQNVDVDQRGRFQVYGDMYQLRQTSPASFVWADGTVQTVERFNGDTIVWRTTHADYRHIFWDRHDPGVNAWRWRGREVDLFEPEEDSGEDSGEDSDELGG